jgi:hypothetical protein
MALILHPYICVAMIALAVFMYMNHRIFLRNNLYLEEISKAGGKEKKSSEYAWLQRFGNIGDLIGVELKLILRNKRPRTLLIIAAFFLLYGLIMYKPELIQKGNFGIVFMLAVFITGMFSISYGQFLFAWQSSYFDGLMASNISIKNYIKSKFVLLSASATIALFPSLLYGLMSWKIIPIQIAAYLFNVGVQPVISGFLAMYHYKGFDMNQSATFNYQGMSAVQWLYSLVIILTGVILYLPFTFSFHSAWAGIAAIGIIGLINFMLRDRWIDFFAKQFFKHKYKILEGFREK